MCQMSRSMCIELGIFLLGSRHCLWDVFSALVLLPRLPAKVPMATCLVTASLQNKVGKVKKNELTSAEKG